MSLIFEQITEALSSEHTSYKSTKKYLNNLPIEGPHVIQGPGENAGIVRLGDALALTLRIESHNHPSFINPYQGAATGVGGILRDNICMGARPIALLDFLRFGVDEQAIHLRKEVVRGIADYGNTVGVPIVGGDIFFDKTYNHNCLVNIACLGLVKEVNITYGRVSRSGDVLIYVGAKTGRDGVRGAQMASQILNTLDKTAVQDPDPFLQKLLLDACYELTETTWIVGMQDVGAAGLLCSTTEVIKRGREHIGQNLGVIVDLNKVPTKAQDMTAIELLLSESQERMLIVAREQHVDDVIGLFKEWDLEAVNIGTVIDDGSYTIQYKGETWTKSFDLLFPDVEQDWPLEQWITQNSPHLKCLYGENSRDIVKSIWRQYDHMVGTRTIKGPDTNGQYAILNIPEIQRQIIVSWASDEGQINYNSHNYMGKMFDRMLQPMIGFGAIPLGLTNCLNFGHPKDSMGIFVQVVNCLTECCNRYKIPVVSGNVSLYNAHEYHSIKPTVILVMVGVM